MVLEAGPSGGSGKKPPKKKPQGSGNPFEDFYNSAPGGPPASSGGRAAPATNSPAPYTKTNRTTLTPMVEPSVQLPATELPEMFPSDMWTMGGPVRGGIPRQEGDLGMPSDEPVEVVEGFKINKVQKPKKSYQMTWDEYQALSPEQRAAVDFNTMLIQARETDLNRKGRRLKPQAEGASPDPEKAIYLKAVEDMFGKEGGSDIFAPETMAVLQQIDYKPEEGSKRGDDLDDFLGLKVVINSKDLKNMGELNSSIDLLELTAASADEQTALQAQLATHTAEMQETLDKGYNIIRDYSSLAEAARSRGVAMLGGSTVGDAVDPSDVFKGNEEFQQYFELMSTRAYMADASLWSAIEEDLRTAGGPQQVEKFKAYADKRSEISEANQLPLGTGLNVDYLTPEEFREILGLNQRTDKGADDGQQAR